MRAGVAVAVLAVVALVVSCAPPPSDPGLPPTTLLPLPAPPSQFSLLTYNVAGLPQEFSTVNPKEHIPLISPLLNEYDVVLTQEDFDWWVPLAGLLDFANYHRRLRAESTHPYRSDVHPGPSAVGVNPQARPLLVGDGIGFLSRYPLLDERHGAWEKCFGDAIPPGAGDCLAMKGFRAMTMVLGDGLEVDVYNLHAEAGGTDRDQALQVLDYEQLAAAIEQWSAGRAVIVAGDTNLHIGDHEDGSDGEDAVIWQTFLDRVGLSDVCDELGCSSPTSIDKVAFRNGGGVQLTPLTHDMPRARFTSPSGEDLSDHPPVVVEFGWDVLAGT
jgi:endonuclease/exonuclease/phosphatase (EEP) superfamily protein YafD